MSKFAIGQRVVIANETAVVRVIHGECGPTQAPRYKYEVETHGELRLVPERSLTAMERTTVTTEKFDADRGYGWRLLNNG